MSASRPVHFPHAGERVPVIAGYSEVLIHFQLAGRPIEVELIRNSCVNGDPAPGYMAQVYRDGAPFSAPILPGEAGFREEDERYYIRPDPDRFDGPARSLAALRAGERTFCLLKPDAFRRGLYGQVFARLEAAYFRPVALGLVAAPGLDYAASHYAEHVGQPYFDRLVTFLATGPVGTAVLELPHGDAVPALRRLMGAFQLPRVPGTIRGDLMSALALPHENLIHGSDSRAAAVREAALWGFALDEPDGHWGSSAAAVPSPSGVIACPDTHVSS